MEKAGIPGGTLTLSCTLDGESAPSVDCVFSSASWYERKIRDLFGIDFPGAFDRRRLVLHECYPEGGFHPMKKSVPNRPFSPVTAIPPEEEYQFMPVEGGKGVYQIPVGPVHAGIIEPGHFRFSAVGETVVNLEVRMFYKHRGGIEKLAEGGKRPDECVAVAEAVSGDESVANALGFALAVERIAGVAVPGRAEYLRTIYAELERIHSHLGSLAGMLVDVAYPPVGASRFTVLREEIFRLNRDLTGSRFMRGRRQDRRRGRGPIKRPAPGALVLPARCGGAVPGVAAGRPRLPPDGHRPVCDDRGRRAAVHPPAPPHRSHRPCVGLDPRRPPGSPPYGAYADLAIPVRMLTGGDVLARFSLRRPR